MGRKRAQEDESSVEWKPSDDSDSDNEESDADSDSAFEKPARTRRKIAPTVREGKKPAKRARGRPAKGGDDGGARGGHGQKARNSKAGTETGTYCIELAKTGRAHCRVCGSVIPLRGVRLGVEVDESGWGVITRWQHLECSRLPVDVSLESVQGYERLDPEHQEAAARTLHADSPPEHLQEVDPDEVLRQSVAARTKEREPPASIVTPLLKFQKVGLAWMCDQEHGDVHGGILADEMGMGKTIQAVALIAAHKQHERLAPDEPPPADHPALVHNGGSTSGDATESLCAPCTVGGGTLVLCPVVALVQWRAEIVKVTDGSLSVFVYHGGKRPDDVAALARYDIVLSTYSTIEADYRRMSEPHKVACEFCGRRFQRDKLEVHLRWFCGPEANRSAAQAKTEKRKARNSKGSGKGTGKTVNKTAGTKGATVIHVDDDEEPPSRRLRKRSLAPASVVVDVEEEEEEEEDDDDDESEDDEDEGGESCLTCGGTKSTAKNPLMLCDTPRCDGAQHLDCSSFTRVPSGDWFCPRCSVAGSKGKGRGNAPAAWKGQGGKAAAKTPGKAPVKRQAPDATSTRLPRGSGSVDVSRAPGGAQIVSAAVSARTKVSEAKAKRFFGIVPSSDSGDESDDEDDDLPPAGRPRGASRARGGGGRYAASPGVSRSGSGTGIGARKGGGGSATGSARSVLHEILWQRVVLDEAHAIKDRRCSTAQAVFALRSSLKWALSGTPLQNRVGELYSLVQYLRLDPLSYYFCSAKGCECKSAHYRFSGGWRKCVDCGHSPLQHFSYFNRHILNPIQKFGYVGEGRKAMLTLKQQVLDRALLRRTKQERAEDISLPPKLVKLRRDVLDERELDFYNAIYTQSVAQFDTYVQKGVVLNNYAHIFDLLTRLRQAVDHPYLVIHSARAELEETSNLSAAHKAGRGAVDADEVCGLCHDVAVDPVTASCRHAFCRACASDFVNSFAGGMQAQCPTCWRPFTIDLSRPADTPTQGTFATPAPALGPGCSVTGRGRRGILSRINLSKFQSSTKIESLMEELSMMESRDPVGKAIVFSQFVSMLDLIEWRLHRGGVQVVKLDGSMSVSARSAAIDAFMNDPSVKVILISLKAGGVALNLTVATHIFLMDPWWNPAAEMQAIDRAHRIGQHKPVRAVRFIMKNTVEERILMLQDKKKLVFEGTVGGDVGALTRLSEEDMRFLFQN